MWIFYFSYICFLPTRFARRGINSLKTYFTDATVVRLEVNNAGICVNEKHLSVYVNQSFTLILLITGDGKANAF